MAGYPKIWTTLLSEDWFVPLSLNAKGLYLWLIIEAKRQGDTGHVTFTGWSGLGQQVVSNRSTVARIVSNFEHLGKVRIVEKTARCMRLEIVNYDKYQTLRTYSPRRVVQKLVPNFRHQPEQSRPDHKTRQPEGIVDNVDKASKSEGNPSSVQSAFFKKFKKNLTGQDYETLIKKYGDEQLLLMMIRNITLNNSIKNPVGLLIIARDAPGSHLPDNKYDDWKREMRNVASRIP